MPWFYFNDDLDGLKVPQAQYDKLSELQKQLDNKNDELRDSLRATQMKLVQQTFERDVALEALLTDEQLKSLNAQRMQHTRDHAASNAEFLRQLATLLDSLATFAELTIYEGVRRASPDELQEIKNENKTIEIGKWAFYAEPLDAEPSVVERLRCTLSDHHMIEPYSGGKFCGGFHPDFAAHWKIGDEPYYALVCFGCFELSFISPVRETTFDFNDTAWKTFAQVAIATFVKHKDIIEQMNEMMGQ